VVLQRRCVDRPSDDSPPLTPAARRTANGSAGTQVDLPDRTVRLRPFVDIGRESYSLYQDTREPAG
jgi:hypothetical protein